MGKRGNGRRERKEEFRRTLFPLLVSLYSMMLATDYSNLYAAQVNGAK
jgi:hypothetical protein